ncbi:hypothetical protein [Actinomadura chokoriensis]|uniref:Transcriptional regulator n=1 Tax=Actinomadura chokoriensis TaxID=454156 RepID=A0ABV4R2T3_9ACTN
MERTKRLLVAAALTVTLGPATVGTTPASADTVVAPFLLQVGSTMPALPGKAVALATGPGGAIAAAHTEGVAVWDSGRWTEVTGGAAYKVAWRGDALVALTAKGLLTARRDGAGQWQVSTGRLPEGVDAATALLAGGSDVVLVQGEGLYRQKSGQSWQHERLPGTAVALARAEAGTLAVATSAGLFEQDGRTWKPVTLTGDTGTWASTTITHLTYDSKGRLWFAGGQGIGVRDGKWKLYDPSRGLPLLGFTALAPGADGDVWLGTARGAIRFDGEHWEYRQGRRWLPDDAVAAIAVDGKANAYLGTAGAVGLIEAQRTTLAKKAEVYEQAIDARHRRTQYGFVEGVELDKAGDLSKWTQHDSDNDGLWTGMYGAGESFRYAASKDPQARENARKVFEALKFLGDVTQGGSNPAPAGFPARTVRSTSDTDPNVKDSPERDKEKQKGDALWKISPKRWPTSADGKWYWKSDTSSDELVGHYFFNALYYDLVAEDGAEKKEVASVITRITDHLLDHDLYLVDHDGKPTRWGFFNPSELNGNPWRREERGLNSQTILTFLTIADHVSDDGKYAAAKKKLISESGYEMNTLAPKVTLGVGGGNQSDDEMAFMNYYHLLKYEDEPALKRSWSRSLYDYWQLEQYELNPLFNFIAGVHLKGATWSDAYGPVELDPTGPWLAQSVDTLKRFPLNLVNWKQNNSGRLDITNLGQQVRPDDDASTLGMLRSGTVLPVDERVVGHWNHDPYKLDQGGSGTTEYDGASFLLPYWMGRYHQFISEK